MPMLGHLQPSFKSSHSVELLVGMILHSEILLWHAFSEFGTSILSLLTYQSGEIFLFLVSGEIFLIMIFAYFSV